jgi:glyceraldehyde-3-phosphate dehydrogenase (NAD(P))
MKVLVNGIGNIGKTVLGILCDYKELLGIDEIYALKNSEITVWNQEELNILAEKGVQICSKSSKAFKSINEVINTIDYIFDCNANTFGLKNKTWYNSLPNLKGCSAQGSEKGFGTSFMSGVNDHQIIKSKFVHVVSCNTHAIASLITTIANKDLSNLMEGDFVIVRRSEDIGNHQRLVSGNVLSRHQDREIGTHHAIDVKDLFRTKNQELHIQSSDITTPSQLMHAVRFNISLHNRLDPSQLKQNIKKNPNVSVSQKFDSNIIFELGRRYSPYGRLFSHAIINDNNILLDEKDRKIKGWAFIPQEGNTILSTIHAFLLQTEMRNADQIINALRKDLIRAQW